MDKNKWKYIAVGLAWLATGLAVAVAVYITKSASPLWAMFIPAFVTDLD